MSIDFQTILLIIAFIWLIVLTVVVLLSILKYKKIVDGTSEPTAAGLLNKIAHEHGEHAKNITALLERATKLEQGSLSHIQKIGLTRFNPFKDTGGDQSFIMALLDAEDSGVVISGLFSRAGTRWYAKKVEKGKAVEYELSDEEKKAIARAK